MYFADRIFDFGHSLEHVIKIAAFIAQQVEEAVQYCGQGGMIVALEAKGGQTVVSVREIAAELPDFEGILLDYSRALDAAKPSMLERLKGSR